MKCIFETGGRITPAIRIQTVVASKPPTAVTPNTSFTGFLLITSTILREVVTSKESPVTSLQHLEQESQAEHRGY